MLRKRNTYLFKFKRVVILARRLNSCSLTIPILIWTSSRLNSSKTWNSCSLVLFSMFSVLQIRLVICGTSTSQYFTELLSNSLFFPNIAKLLPPENKAPQQTPVRNWTLKTEVELGKYYSRILISFHRCKTNLTKHRIQYYILLNIKYISIFKHTS